MEVRYIKEGDKVRYCPAYTLKETNGVVKEVRVLQPGVVWVVYNCGGDWKNYRDYTSAQTNLMDLKPGWN